MWTLVLILHWSLGKAPAVVPGFKTEKACMAAAARIGEDVSKPHQSVTCLNMDDEYGIWHRDGSR